MKRDDLFRCRGVLFQRYATNTGTYFWRSEDGRIVCGDKVVPAGARMTKVYLAKIDGALLFGKFPTLLAAMSAAVEAIQYARAAA